MIILKRDIEDNRYLIKQIINETSEMYDNFSHFIIKTHDIVDDWLTIVLYFNENETDVQNKTEKIAVEYIENVLYNNIPELANNASSDFPGYIKIDALRQKKRKHMADIILTYKVPKDSLNYKLSHIQKISWSGGRHSGGYSNFLVYKYTGLDFYNKLSSKLNTDIQIQFNYGEDYIIISESLNSDTEKYLFKLQIDKVNSNKIRITKFIHKEDGCYHNEHYNEVFFNDIYPKDMHLLMNALVTTLEKDLNIKISKSSYNQLKKDLQSHFENKIEYLNK
ncbi:hypothetical protein HMPREF1092_03203 [Clostridium thermobutyricum]|uniref:Uncharacterized protein n=1 Tax=Clostridium thermobutyricum TaxID=29372 RepID=N9XID1_9CLOT|nr:hypothetical protein [Clostridium thermobutyricum]ENY99462.1 hypothetical protein HMPREF1092_03203 [Clostridium thermobutyricum]